MGYQPPYPWYIDPLTHGILTPLPIPMEYRPPPTHDIFTSLPISLLEMGGGGGVKIPVNGLKVTGQSHNLYFLPWQTKSHNMYTPGFMYGM